MLGQKLSGALTNKAYSEAVDYALERQLLGTLDLIKNILSRLIAHAFELEQVGLRQLV